MSASRKKLLPRLVAILIFVFLYCSSFFMWSDINSTVVDIDIQTGRIRQTRYLFYIPIKRTVEDSFLTQVLLPEDIDGSQANWQRVITSTPGLNHSPHYIYHGAISQTIMLEMTWKNENFTREEKRESAKQVLRLWQQCESDYEAGEYIIRLSEEKQMLRKTRKDIQKA